MDYKHNLEFGLFLNPDVHAPKELLRVAGLGDSLGLDFVGIQDHPYNAQLMETVTLMTAIAVRTEQIKVQSTVICLPLRLPAMLAKEMVTLDLLAGSGRIELGLGAGAFWQAIAGFGGTVRTPGEAVEALEEAIAVIRGLWSPKPVFSFNGKYYSVKGIRPGPIPQQPIPIGIGSVGPRMLGVTGRLADDWIASGRTTIAQLAEGNRLIDAAAIASGRDPSAITRSYCLNAQPGLERLDAQAWVARATMLALEHGVSRFWVFPATPNWDDTLRFLSEEVAPEVRAQIAAARAS